MRSSMLALMLAAAPACALAQPGYPAGQQAPPAQAGSLGQPYGGAGPAGSGLAGRGRSLTLADFQSRFRDRFMRADANHDGRISLAEWQAASAQRPGGARGDPARIFERMDLNHDGYLTPAEIDAFSAQRFAHMDRNHDGVITPDERLAGRAGRAGGVGAPGVQARPGGVVGGGGGEDEYGEPNPGPGQPPH